MKFRTQADMTARQATIRGRVRNLHFRGRINTPIRDIAVLASNAAASFMSTFDVNAAPAPTLAQVHVAINFPAQIRTAYRRMSTGLNLTVVETDGARP